MKKKIIIPIILLLLVMLPLTMLEINKKEYKIERIDYQTESNRTPVYWTLGGCVSNCGYANAILNDISNLLNTNSINSDTITKIVFNNVSTTGNKVTSDISMDVSKTQDGSVLALVANDTLYIQYDGILYLNENSSYLFSNMKKVVKIDGLEYVDTSNVTNMGYMFKDVSSLTRLDLSNFDTGKVTDMSYMFKGMSSLTSLDLSNFNTNNVTDMSYMFDNMSSITELDVSNFDTSNVTRMRYMFYGMSSLNQIDVSHLNTSKVKDMDGMFSNLSITELDVSNFDTSNVTRMNSMFNNMRSLTSLDLSNFNTSKVTSMHEMFRGLISLTELDISGFDTSNVTNMGLMFLGTSSLTSLDLSNFDTGKVTDMKYMFDNMRSITSLDLSSFDTSSVTDMSYMFYKMDSLEKIYISEKFDTSKATNMSNMFHYSSKLVGWNGTKYDSNYFNGEYARLDALSNPGYFSAKVESDKYFILPTNDYIYIGDNLITKDIANNITTTYGNISIEDSKLVISYNNENVKEYNLVNTQFNNMYLKDKTIIVKKNIQYEDFVFNITKNEATYKVYDSEREVTTGNITTGMKLKVYVGEVLVDIYEIIEEYIKISNNFSFNETTNIIEDLTVGQTVEGIKENIDTTGTVKIINQENNEVTDTVGTGYKVVIELCEEVVEYTLVVSGDITGDGEIKMSDVMKAATQMFNENTIVGDCYLKAADVTGDGKIKMSDVMKLANSILEGGSL